MSYDTLDMGSVGPGPGLSDTPSANDQASEEIENYGVVNSDIIEVDGHSHPSPKSPVTDIPHATDSSGLPLIPAPVSISDKAPEAASGQHYTGHVAEASSSLSSSLSSTSEIINPNSLEASSVLHLDDTPAEKQKSLASSTIPPEHGSYSTIKMSMPSQINKAPGSGRGSKQYQLDDGSVVAGKGLGRGRPGVKRGPRTGSSNGNGSGTSTPISGSISNSGAPSAATQILNRKRRTASDGSKIKAESPDFDSSLSESRESTPEYNPADETRSGRKIQKPPTTRPVTSESASPAAKRPKLEGRNTTNTASPAVKSHPKIKRRMYRGREQLALCEHCQRGHGPYGNAIVFCDACNRCWHQRCHDPQVPQSTVSDSKAEWFCSNCEKILHGKKGRKGKLSEAAAAQAKPPMPQFVGPLIGGAALTQAHKIAFLESRTREQLISLILQGSDLAPALPMFQAPAPQLPQAQFKSNYVTPISSTPGLHTATTAADAEDEGYDSYFDDHAALYPKPGQGVKLPPDAVDLHMLLEHPQSRTFSHWIRGMPTREFSGNADIVFQR